jgi:hypothetical protein
MSLALHTFINWPDLARPYEKPARSSSASRSSWIGIETAASPRDRKNACGTLRIVSVARDANDVDLATGERCSS